MNEQARDPEVQQEPEPSMPIDRISVNPQALIMQALAKEANVETLERLFGLAERVQAARARSAWYDAMAKFQGECPQVLKNKTAKIPTKGGGSYSFSYASLDELLGTVQPVMGPNGLSISFRLIPEQSNAAQATYVCRISHAMGHHEDSGPVTIPITQVAAGQEQSGANPAQRVAIAHTYAKRYAALAILGLAPTDDESAQDDGPAEPQEPRRASQQAASAAATPNPWTGVITGTRILKAGTGKDGAWKLYALTGYDGTEFSTFDGKAEALARGGEAVVIHWHDEKGYRRLDSIVAAGA